MLYCSVADYGCIASHEMEKPAKIRTVCELCRRAVCCKCSVLRRRKGEKKIRVCNDCHFDGYDPGRSE